MRKSEWWIIVLATVIITLGSTALMMYLSSPNEPAHSKLEFQIGLRDGAVLHLPIPIEIVPIINKNLDSNGLVVINITIKPTR